MASAVGPSSRSLVEVSPEQLSFKLAPNSQPGCALTVRNSSDVAIAFKVKTTEPKRYLVRPNQGLVSSGGREAVNVWLVEKECNGLIQNFRSSAADGASMDKFLVQTTAVGDAFRARVASLALVKQAEELTILWGNADKSSVRNKKLAVRFLPPALPTTHFPSPTASGATAAAAAAPHPSPIASNTPRTPVKHLSRAASPVSSASPLAGGGKRYSAGNGDWGRAGEQVAPHRGSPSLDEDSRELVSKYDDLVNYTANLTEERDELNQALEEAKKALQKEMAMRISLETRGHLPSRRQGPNSSRASIGGRVHADFPQRGTGGFGWLTLSLVAIIFFFLGQWLDFAGDSSGLGSRGSVVSKASVGLSGPGRAASVIPESSSASRVASTMASASKARGEGRGGGPREETV